MESTQIEQEIIAEIYQLFENIGAKSDILSTIGSWKDTQEDEQILGQLKILNKIYGKKEQL